MSVGYKHTPSEPWSTMSCCMCAWFIVSSSSYILSLSLHGITNGSNMLFCSALVLNHSNYSFCKCIQSLVIHFQSNYHTKKKCTFSFCIKNYSKMTCTRCWSVFFSNNSLTFLFDTSTRKITGFLLIACRTHSNWTIFFIIFRIPLPFCYPYCNRRVEKSPNIQIYPMNPKIYFHIYTCSINT